MWFFCCWSSATQFLVQTQVIEARGSCDRTYRTQGEERATDRYEDIAEYQISKTFLINTTELLVLTKHFFTIRALDIILLAGERGEGLLNAVTICAYI